MRNSINVSVMNVVLEAKLKDKVNAKGNAGYYANGKVSLQIPATLPETFVVTVDGQPLEARLKRNEDGSIKFSDKGNMGWRVNGKATDKTGIMQVGGDVTICKCGGQLPAVGQVVMLQVGCNITRYTPSKAPGKPVQPIGANNGNKSHKKLQTSVAQSQVATIASQSKSEDDLFMEKVRQLLAGK